MEKQKRNTKTKQMVMDILSGEPDAAHCHSDIVQQLDGKMDRVTVYRILQGFCDDGLVHKVADDNGKTYYALCRDCSAGHHDDDHLHFRCVSCDTVSCIEASQQILRLPRGYKMSAISCFISGYCPNCRPSERNKRRTKTHRQKN
jgi:Fe2+ or Zn2+ uptake regulation protein